jgi:NADPH-dependent 2,4-dienoyl-CoA reductase/sulfur reductase-like enzyme
MAKRLIVIGGVAAGMSAAAKARRTDPSIDIAVYTDEEYISYAGCGLPYFISGTIKTKDKLIARSVEDFSKQNISVKMFSKVASIEPENRRVLVTNTKDKTDFEDKYDRLVIATGARALVPDLKGIEKKGIFKLRTINDSLEIKEYLNERQPQRIAIIGGGYIGLEMVESFVNKGCRVSLIERAPHIIPNMDEDMAVMLSNYLESKDVDVHVGEAVKGFTGDDYVKSVVTDKGEIPADFVLLSIGVLPNSEIASDCGIRVGARNAILVDKKMTTSIPNIYAAGDCATASHLISGKDVYIPLGTTANKQGRIAGENAAGGDAIFNGIIGTGIARIMEMEVSRTGLCEKECREAGIEYESRKIKSRTAAHYCPTSGEINLKLTADKKTERLIGAQIVGFQGSAARIDMLAAAITSGATISRMKDMDLAYSPPFSPVWDPVLVALNQF